MSGPFKVQPSKFKVGVCLARRVRLAVPALLNWFRRGPRDLPWRRTRDPYGIWVSEIMLQQTQVKTVIPYWERWMRKLPTLQSLAQARPEKVLKLWEGLGYYTRARNLQKAARVVVEKHGGRFPGSFEEILALPGVGRYTAGAICSIAFNQPAPVVDGNVTRVLCRLFCIRGDPKQKKINARLWKLAESLVQEAAAIKQRPQLSTFTSQLSFNCSHLNQSLMELGAVICTPRQPKCADCPLRSHCVAYQKGCAGSLPNSGRRAATTARRYVALVVERRGRFLVRQRAAGTVNAGLWEFPNVEVQARDRISLNTPTLEPLCTIRHSITRYRISLEAFYVHSRQLKEALAVKSEIRNPKSEIKVSLLAFAAARSDGCWLRLRDLRRLAFTGAHRKVLAALEARISSKR